ncbi:aminoglycoside adenylyltransferase domain-containing protein [Clostridium hydrogeniformans]|uniref:aminoglycoside adenylyltransferase domain-containing protein n=1 Tax=Clostridium hydrogeniformans TaxID=349933 RepID=UPI0005572468|nr:aminoglycoside adenylyltransferase domain-containing protein [Clostridium hydrogeniformans]
MRTIENILKEFKNKYCNILRENLVGIYLHGSLAMGCFNYYTSDIDILVVVNKDMELEIKRKLINVILELSKDGPEKGFEVSVILYKHSKNFIYPTPFLLHYSKEYNYRYLSDSEFICGNSVDKDLAAHMVITRKRGICLVGKPIEEVFQEVPKEYYIDSIIGDIEGARESIVENPIYNILNLCRVLYYLKEEAICSKKEGGQWAYSNMNKRYKEIVKSAMELYENKDKKIEFSSEELVDFADFILREIKGHINII